MSSTLCNVDLVIIGQKPFTIEFINKCLIQSVVNSQFEDAWRVLAGLLEIPNIHVNDIQRKIGKDKINPITSLTEVIDKYIALKGRNAKANKLFDALEDQACGLNAVSDHLKDEFRKIKANQNRESSEINHLPDVNEASSTFPTQSSMPINKVGSEPAITVQSPLMRSNPTPVNDAKLETTYNNAESHCPDKQNNNSISCGTLGLLYGVYFAVLLGLVLIHKLSLLSITPKENTVESRTTRNCPTLQAKSYLEYEKKTNNLSSNGCISFYLQYTEHMYWPPKSVIFLPLNLFVLSINGPLGAEGLQNMLDQTQMIERLEVGNINITENQSCQLSHLNRKNHNPDKKLAKLNSLTVKDLNCSVLNMISSNYSMNELKFLTILDFSFLPVNLYYIRNLLKNGGYTKLLEVHTTFNLADEGPLQLEILLGNYSSLEITAVPTSVSKQSSFDLGPSIFELSDGLKNVNITLGFLTYKNINHLFVSTELKSLAVSLIIEPADFKHLEIPYRFPNLQNLYVYLDFTECPDMVDAGEHISSKFKTGKRTEVKSNCWIGKNGSASIIF